MDLKEITGLLRDKEPVLNNPEGLSEAIMAGIGKSLLKGKRDWLRQAERLLAAAAVALLLAFGFEQFTIVAEVSNLEYQLSKAGKANLLTDPATQESCVILMTQAFPVSEAQRLLSGLKPRSPFTSQEPLQVKTISE